MTTATATPQQKQNVVVTRTFDAPVASVWKAWSDSDQVKRWWGPTCFTSPLAKMDFREGGTSLVCMSAPQFGDLYSTWHYLKIEPLKSIEYLHNLANKDGVRIDPTSIGMPEDFPQNQRHVVLFEIVDGDRTKLTVTEYEWNVSHMMQMAILGMEQCLEKMAISLAS